MLFHKALHFVSAVWASFDFDHILSHSWTCHNFILIFRKNSSGKIIFTFYFSFATLRVSNYFTRNANQHLTPVCCALCASCGGQQLAYSTLSFVADCIIKDNPLSVKENPIAAQSFTSGEIMKCSHAIHYVVRVDN
jgi:hypothetical protein